MKKLLSIILLVLLFSVTLTAPVFASDMGEPLAGGMNATSCPDAFHLHHVMDHGDDPNHMHNHIGNDADQNGDGYICMKHVGVNENNHVHIDNNVPY